QPFIGEQPVHIAFQHVHEDIPAPSTLVTGVPRELDSLVTWAASRVVEQRPATAAELLAAVRDLTGSLPGPVLEQRPVPRPEGDTGAVPRPTSPLEDDVAELRGAPRAFPAGLLSASEDAPPSTLPSSVGAGLPASPAGDAPQAAAGADTAGAPTGLGDEEQDEHQDEDREGPAAPDARDGGGEEDAGPRTVVMRSPRARRGRHLPPGTRRRSRP